MNKKVVWLNRTFPSDICRISSLLLLSAVWSQIISPLPKNILRWSGSLELGDYLLLAGVAFMALLSYLPIALWVWNDAKKNIKNQKKWLLIVLLLRGVGVVLYFSVQLYTKLLEKGIAQKEEG